jgi:hypothetical protein
MSNISKHMLAIKALDQDVQDYFCDKVCAADDGFEGAHEISGFEKLLDDWTLTWKPLLERIIRKEHRVKNLIYTGYRMYKFAAEAKSVPGMAIRDDIDSAITDEEFMKLLDED